MDRSQEIKKALSMDNGFLEDINWREDVEWLIKQSEKVERYKRVMDKILAMEEYTSTFEHSYSPVSIKEAKKLIRELYEPEKEIEEIKNELPSEEVYQKIVKIMNK